MNFKVDFRHILTSSLLLGLFGVAGAGLVAAVFDSTEERIEANIRAHLLKSLNQIMPSASRTYMRTRLFWGKG